MNIFDCLDELQVELFKESIEEIEGPSNKEFAQIYQENGFGATERAKAITLFLIGRTLVAFWIAANSIKIDVPLCIGFHDQDPIMRIKENLPYR